MVCVHQPWNQLSHGQGWDSLLTTAWEPAQPDAHQTAPREKSGCPSHHAGKRALPGRTGPTDTGPRHRGHEGQRPHPCDANQSRQGWQAGVQGLGPRRTGRAKGGFPSSKINVPVNLGRRAPDSSGNLPWGDGEGKGLWTQGGREAGGALPMGLLGLKSMGEPAPAAFHPPCPSLPPSCLLTRSHLLSVAPALCVLEQIQEAGLSVSRNPNLGKGCGQWGWGICTILLSWLGLRHFSPPGNRLAILTISPLDL